MRYNTPWSEPWQSQPDRPRSDDGAGITVYPAETMGGGNKIESLIGTGKKYPWLPQWLSSLWKVIFSANKHENKTTQKVQTVYIAPWLYSKDVEEEDIVDGWFYLSKLPLSRSALPRLVVYFDQVLMFDHQMALVFRTIFVTL